MFALTIFYITFTILLLFAFDNGDMSLPKRHVFISLLLILKCFSKPFITRSSTLKLKLTELILTPVFQFIASTGRVQTGHKLRNKRTNLKST